MFDFGIIGGGAAGIYASILLAQKGYSVALIEGNERVGKKLLATGNGKCNLANEHIDEDCYNTPIVLDMVKNFSMQEKMAQLGLVTKIKSGRIYPLSEQSNNVLNVLLCNMNRYGVKVLTKHFARDIKAEDIFTIETSAGKITCKNICLATGSEASFGNDSLSLYQKFGHKITKVKPSLAPMIVTKQEQIKGLNGVRQEGLVSLVANGEVIAKEYGEVQFRKDGVSGIVIMNHSARMCRNNLDKATCYIDFMPHFSYSEVEQLLENNITAEFGLLNKNLMQNAIKFGVDGIKNYRIDVQACRDMKLAQAANGGLNLTQFDLTTMQSKLKKGLYAIGEALDVDGLCGGYNLHFAFASAYNFAKGF